jgi:hypothetical protein
MRGGRHAADVPRAAALEFLPGAGLSSRFLQRSATEDLSLAGALHLKSAESWLKLGEPIEPLIELEALPAAAGKLKSVLSVKLAALRAVRLCATHYPPRNVNTTYDPVATSEGEVVALFGDAQLIKTLDCKFELHGGSREDRLAAREWISLFLHEAVVREV